MPSRVSAEPGLIRIRERTPYAVEVAKAATTQGIEEVVFVSGTQVGKTTIQELVLGYWIDVEPGPTLIVKPSEDACTRYMKSRIRPILKGSPALKRHMSASKSDNTLDEIELDTMPLYMGWAGSPQSLASTPCRRIICDEVDKFPAFSGKEADPVSLARERTATYGHRRCVFLCSTPTTREGPIWKALEACGVRLYYFVPCPHCGKYQRLVWDRVKWPKLDIADKVERSDAIEQGKLAWYECEHCKAAIKDEHKPRMLERGKWATETQTIADDGTINGERPASKRIGFHMSSLYSPWRGFSEMAAEFIQAEGDAGKTMNFRNSRLAEPFEQLVANVTPSAIREKAKLGGPAGLVPEWAQLVVATADTQKNWFKLHIGAWGYGYRYQLVREVVCNSFDELFMLALETPFAVSNGGYIKPRALLIDSGGSKGESENSRTNEVYQFAMRDSRIRPTKGSSHSQNRPWYVSHLPSGVALTIFDTGFYKDMLARFISDPDPTKWLPHAGVSEQYVTEMANEHKVRDRKNGFYSWQPKSSGVRVEAWDCEVLQVLAADMAMLGVMPMEPIQPTAPQQQSRENPMNYRGRW